MRTHTHNSCISFLHLSIEKKRRRRRGKRKWRRGREEEEMKVKDRLSGKENGSRGTAVEDSERIGRMDSIEACYMYVWKCHSKFH